MPDETNLKGIIAPECVKELEQPSSMGQSVQEKYLTGIRDAMGFAAKSVAKNELSIENFIINGSVPVRVYRKLSLVGKKLPTIYYVHGGGFIGGWVRSDNCEQICRTFVDHADVQVISIDYRLAPEHPYPAGPMDCYQAVQYCETHLDDYNISSNKSAIMGDSSGANTALVTAMLDSSFYETKYLKKVLLYYPVVDLTTHGKGEFWNPNHIKVEASQRELYNSYIEGFAALENVVENWYAGDKIDRDAPLLSPLYAENDILKSLPPMHVIFGEFDPLRQQNEAFYDKLHALGIKEEVTIFPGMIHAFMDKIGVYPEAVEAVDTGLAWLQKD